jgi:hypothetical protein
MCACGAAARQGYGRDPHPPLRTLLVAEDEFSSGPSVALRSLERMVAVGYVLWKLLPPTSPYEAD